MLVLEIHVPAVCVHQLRRRHELLQRLLEHQLFPRQGVDEGRDDLEKAPDDPRDVDHHRSPQTLGVVGLQNGEDGFARREGGVFGHGSFVVDEQGKGFLTRGHELNGALDHEDEVLDLALACFGVLFCGVEVQAGASGDVEAK